jgi:putative PIN family toxin of toxin-antitoxin system
MSAIACDIIHPGGILRVVLDTDVLVAALRSDLGASRQLLISALDRKIEMLVSVPLMVEYEAVLTRPEHMDASELTAKEVNEVLDAVAKVAIPVYLRFLWRPQLKDPADEMVLETAVNGGADRLVTFNVRHLAAAAREFGIRVVLPRDGWKEVQGRNEKE